MNAHDFKATSIDGAPVDFASFKGKTLLVVNVASQCGLTPQYSGLEALWKKHKDAGLVVIGFPCDQFGHQEPGTEAEIKTFCETRYSVTFPMFSKVKITGDDKHPLFAELTGGKDVQWNFEKFLVGKDGKLIARYGSDAEPEGSEIEAAVKKVLGLP